MTGTHKRTALYRLYDVDDRLMYVGISHELRIRWHHHSISKPWWHLVTRRDIEWHPDRLAADSAETAAIVTESPLYNIDKVPNARADQGRYDDTLDRRRVKRMLRRDVKRRYFYVGRTVHISALAERYDVSPVTLWSFLLDANSDSFTERRQRITILSEPKF